MTRTIDADALLEWLDAQKCDPPEDGHESGYNEGIDLARDHIEESVMQTIDRDTEYRVVCIDHDGAIQYTGYTRGGAASYVTGSIADAIADAAEYDRTHDGARCASHRVQAARWTDLSLCPDQPEGP